ncbi:MAG: YbhN family protein, partial [Leptolyngbyaceae bacterium]|nr:YbhN family protein [Leptolyngbyaceae bacterium]
GWGLTAPQIAQIIAFCNLSFWLGLLTLGGVLLLTQPMDLSTVLTLPESSVQSLGVFALAIVGAYLVVSSLMRRSLSVGWLSIPRLSFPVAIAQIIITCIDWAIAATTIYVLLRPTSLHYLPEVIGVYVIAQLAGVLSTVPGGIGIFETVMILLLPSVAPKIEIIGALIAFRILHHLLPMGLGVLSLMGYELHQLLRAKRERI